MRDMAKPNNKILLVTTEISKHASALEDKLNKLNAPYSRFNTDTPNSRDWPQIKFTNNGGKIFSFVDSNNQRRESREFSAIWWDEVYPCEEIFKNIEYPQWAFLETKKAMNWIFGSLNIPYIDSPSNIISGSNKLIQLQRANELGLEIPETIISSHYISIRDFVKNESIYKPISRPTSESIGDQRIVLTTKIEKQDISPQSTSCKLSLFQRYIPKKYELRTYVVGD